MLRAEKFKMLVKNKPAPGEVLTAKNANPVPIHVERKIIDANSGQWSLMMFANALIDLECTGWYLTPQDTPKALKVLILPESQESLIEGNKGRLTNLEVAALRVVRHNEKGTALICELIDLHDPLVIDERDIDPRGDS